ncbi:MAG: FCD domain-containing protein [Thalassobaculales bacterium]
MRDGEGTGAPTLASAVHERLREDILAGRLMPGTKLRVEFVSERYEAGASPVREALNRLSAEGLVERRDQRGFYVAAASVADLRELVKTRCWVEGLALRESMAHRTMAWEEAVLLAHHRLSRTPRSSDPNGYRSNPDWEALHRAYHESLIANCGSRHLIRFCADLAGQMDRYRQLAAETIYAERNAGTEHKALLDAVIDGDAERAVGLLTGHYQRTLRIIEGTDLFAAE